MPTEDVTEMTTRQTILAAIILAGVCCGVMWVLEGFRQRQMIEEFRGALADLPTYLGKDNAP